MLARAAPYRNIRASTDPARGGDWFDRPYLAGQHHPPPAETFRTSERGIQGSVMGLNRFRRDTRGLVQLYQQGRLNLDELISAHIA